MFNINKFVCFVLLTIAILSSSLLGLGISISPGANLTYVRQLGEELSLPPLTIFNVNESPMEYKIKTQGASRVTGYYSIPDIEWVRLGTDIITIEPFDTVEVPVYVTHRFSMFLELPM